MTNGSKFKRLDDDIKNIVTIYVDGQKIEARAGDSVAAAVLATKFNHTRTTPVTNAKRAPYCMMGVCFECLMEIDAIPNRQACMTIVKENMIINRQLGARPHADKS